ncbi:hypothetical protein [Actinokineospora sp. NPDC004072]
MERSVYLIAPVGSDPTYRNKRAIVERLADKQGVSVHFPMDGVPATSDSQSTLPTAEMVELFRKAGRIIADLSFERPSCYYELGVAQTVRRDVVLVAEVGTNLHQAEGRSEAFFYHDLKQYADFLDQVIRQVNSYGHG